MGPHDSKFEIKGKLDYKFPERLFERLESERPIVGELPNTEIIEDVSTDLKPADSERDVIELPEIIISEMPDDPPDLPASKAVKEEDSTEKKAGDGISGGEETQHTELQTDASESEDSKDDPEYNEDGTRELTEDEKQYLKDKLGWSDDKIKKCTIDEDGVIHYKTDRCDLEGKTSEKGVPYERRIVEVNGVKIEGVFPVFDSVFDTQLDPDNLKTNAYAKECNAKLKEAIANDPELRSKFTEEQLKDIEEGRTPTGYVWHHNEEPGKMQLVKREDHDRVIGGAAHTGGNSLWGADSVDNSKKGEQF